MGLEEHSSVPTTPETNYSKRNQSMSKKKSKTTIDPKRIEARLASQRYRDTKLSEYNTLTSTHNRLLTLNQNLRYELIKHGKIIELKPPLLDLTTVPGCEPNVNWKRAATRKERNRQAAKRSREAAKRKHRVLAAQNQHIEHDTVQLKIQLQEFKKENNITAGKRKNETQEVLALDALDALDTLDPLDSFDAWNNELVVNTSSKKRKTNPTSPFRMQDSHLLLVACVLTIIGMSCSSFDTSTTLDGNRLHVGMDISTGLLQHLKLNDEDIHPLPLITASVVCLGSFWFAVYNYYFNESK